MSKIEQYLHDGYIVLKNVIPKPIIAEIREIGFDLLEKRREQGQISIYNQEFVAQEKLVCIPFLKDVVAATREVFGGDYVTFSQFSLTANAHSPIWHTDSQSQQNAEYLFNPNYLISKCGLYLQEHDPVYAGSMEIIPYSHKPTFMGSRSIVGRDKKFGQINTLQWKAIQFRNQYCLRKKIPPMELGDVLLFHGLLVHRASQPNFANLEQIDKFGIQSPPRDKYKFMIQWEVSPNNEFVPIYLAHQKFRAAKEGGLYQESLQIKFPNDYHEAARELIAANACYVINYDQAPVHYVQNGRFYHDDGTPIAFLYANH